MEDYLIAIDPGTTESGIVLMTVNDYRPVRSAKVDNLELLALVRRWIGELNIERSYLRGVIEMIQGRYGQGFGSELLETAVWIGRFLEQFLREDVHLSRVVRMDEYRLLCANLYQRNDRGIKEALVDRFAKGVPNYGKGTKKSPGWFFGFSADIWQAYAVGVTYIDMVTIGRK